MAVGSETKWNAARTAATTLSPAEDLRDGLARAIAEAARADFVSIMTCPPADWTHGRFTTYPHDHAPLIAQIDREFTFRIDAAGEGWRHAVSAHGCVYTPLEVAVSRPLAEELRDVVMRPADIHGYVVAFILDRHSHLVGMAAIGARSAPGELLDRVIEPLQQTILLAGATLEGAMDLAGACAAPSPRPSRALAALSAREREVASLVTEGLTNLTIGARLGIAETTVAVHLRKIYGKLGVCSRVQLAMQCRDASA